MLSLPQTNSLIYGFALLAVDLLAWHLTNPERKRQRMMVRMLMFTLFTWLLIRYDISPLQPSPWPDDVALNLLSTLLAVLWWVFAARMLTVVITAMFFRRDDHGGRLFKDIVAAAIFLAAGVAAAGYVMQLPVKGLLATSGGMAIVAGLALRSTLSDLFSGIVLNTTKPYQVDDHVQIDNIEGRVTDIDWRATHLMTSLGSMAVIPNAIVANAKVLNLSRPSNLHGVSVMIQVSNTVRPGRVLEALDRAMQGTRQLLSKPPPKAFVKRSTVEFVEYEIRGFIESMPQHHEVCNQLFDLVHRHLEATGVLGGTEHQSATAREWTRQRLLLEDVKIFRSMSREGRDVLAQSMTSIEAGADRIVLDLNEVSDHLMIVSTGVISLSMHDGERLIEAARMGPGEVLGEEGVLTDAPSRGQFRCITSCVLFRIDKTILRQHLDQEGELMNALKKLQLLRQGVRQSLLLQKPVQIKKGGFLRWLKSA